VPRDVWSFVQEQAVAAPGSNAARRERTAGILAGAGPVPGRLGPEGPWHEHPAGLPFLRSAV